MIIIIFVSRCWRIVHQYNNCTGDMSLTQYILFINNHVGKAEGRVFNPPPSPIVKSCVRLCRLLRKRKPRVFRLHRMHEILTFLTAVRSVCLSVSLSVTRLISAAARAVYAECRLSQTTLTTCLNFFHTRKRTK